MLSILDARWRLVATILGFTLFGIGTLITSLVLTLLLPIMPASKWFKRKLTRKVLYFSARFYTQTLVVLGLVNFQRPPRHQLNKPGSLVVANHPMLLDAVFMMSLMPDVTFIVKSALARNPFTFALVHYAGYLTNDANGTELIQLAAQRLKAGETIAIFPEGTRSQGDGQIHFKRGAANIALQANAPILPVHIHCKPNILRKGDKWHYVPTPKPIYRIEPLDMIHVDSHIEHNQAESLQARHLNRAMVQPILAAMQASA